MKILLITDNYQTGMTLYRQMMPFTGLLRKYPQSFEVTAMPCAELCRLISESGPPEADLVHFSRVTAHPVFIVGAMTQYKLKGIPTVFDIDDYWHLPADHYEHAKWKAHDIPGRSIKAMRLASVVTTTTKTLAAKIKEEAGVDAVVVKNCIDPSSEQWQRREIKNRRVRFGWIGGVYHEKDVELMRKGIAAIHKEPGMQRDIQFVLGGYGTGTSDTAKYYHHLESVFTDNWDALRTKHAEYLEYLQARSPLVEHMSYDKPFRRAWGRSINEYGQLYNEIDVALIPLVGNTFTSCKSELKLIEAGHMGKAAIVSDVLPYSAVAEHGYNALCVRGGEWFGHIRKLAKDAALREDLAAGLAETIEDEFDFDENVEVLRQVVVVAREGSRA